MTAATSRFGKHYLHVFQPNDRVAHFNVSSMMDGDAWYLTSAAEKEEDMRAIGMVQINAPKCSAEDVERFADLLEAMAAQLREKLDVGVPFPPIVPSKDMPIPMRLRCPECGALHLDVGEFATKPHHTHACQQCGEVWRPAVVPTVGVKFLPGFRNEP
jgi:rubredoxin